jgi:DNA-binding transcriptional LysR family regulator
MTILLKWFLNPRKMKRKMDTLENLKALVAVVEGGSFSEAARRIGVATSVVKKRVDQLEAQVGTRLFNRSTRSMRLTDIGHTQLPRIRRAIEQVEDVLTSGRSKPAHLEGHLRVKVPTTLMALYLAEMFTTFQRRHRDVRLDVLVVDRPVNPIEEGFDLAIGMLPASFPGVHDEGLCAVRRLVVASPHYLRRRGRPLVPQDLSTHDTLNYAGTGAVWNFQGPVGPVSIELEHKLNSNYGQHLLVAAMNGNGIACLSSYVVLPGIQAGRLEQLLPEYPIPEFWIRMQIPQDRLAVARVQALALFLKGKFVPKPPWEA